MRKVSNSTGIKRNIPTIIPRYHICPTTIVFTRAHAIFLHKKKQILAFLGCSEQLLTIMKNAINLFTIPIVCAFKIFAYLLGRMSKGADIS